MEYEQQQVIEASADEVWDFVSDVDNVADWMVTTHAAMQPGPDSVRLTRDADGAAYEVEGLFAARPDQRRLEWGSRGVGDYSGWLQVYEGGEGRSEVNAHLSFVADQPEAHGGVASRDVDSELRASLRNIADHFAAV